MQRQHINKIFKNKANLEYQNRRLKDFSRVVAQNDNNSIYDSYSEIPPVLRMKSRYYPAGNKIKFKLPQIRVSKENAYVDASSDVTHDKFTNSIS